MGILDKKQTRENYIKRIYGSNSIDLKEQLNNILLNEHFNKGSNLFFIAILKKEGFKFFTKTIENNLDNYTQNSIDNFLDILSKLNDFKEYKNITKNDKIKDLTQKELNKTFEKFSNILLQSKFTIDLNKINNISKIFNLSFELNKKDIQSLWKNDTIKYIEELSNTKEYSEIFDLKKFIKFNLEKNSDLFVNHIENIVNDKEKESVLFNFMKNFNKEISNNFNKYTKIENISNILSDLSDKIEYKIDLIKKDIIDNQNEFDSLKLVLSNTTLVDPYSILHKAENMKNNLEIEKTSKIESFSILKKELIEISKEFNDINLEIER